MLVASETKRLARHPGAGVRRRRYVAAALLCTVFSIASGTAWPASLSETIARVKGSVVAVGTMQVTRRPPAKFMGTGFAVADGRHVLTNAHVLPATLDREGREHIAIFTGSAGKARVQQADVVTTDKVHDLALLRINGERLRPMSLGDSSGVREGEFYAFTGFPIGMVLGLRPVTHRGIVSAITPIVIPQMSSGQLDPALIRRLRNPYEVFQLDATAYPGNSGSPLYDPASGAVIGIVNMVFVKESKENVLEKPSGISYAIPIRYAIELVEKAGLTP